MTTLTLTDTAHRLIRDREDMQVNVTGSWVEFARPTHGGSCPDDPAQQTGPAWDWVDHISNDQSPLVVRGVWGDGQCGGCGQLGRGWVESGARDLSDVDDPEAVMVEMICALDVVWEDVASTQAGAIRRRLREDLAAVVASGVAEAEGDDWEDVAAKLAEAGVFVSLGSDTEPGVLTPSWTARLCCEQGWSAWAADPARSDHTIEVYESDLDA